MKNVPIPRRAGRGLAALLTAIVVSACGMGSSGRMLSENDLSLDFAFLSDGALGFGGCDNASRIAPRMGSLESATFQSNDSGGDYMHVRVTDVDAAALIDSLTTYLATECPGEYQLVDGPEFGDETFWYVSQTEWGGWPTAVIRAGGEVHYLSRTGVGGGEQYIQDLAAIAPNVLP